MLRIFSTAAIAAVALLCAPTAAIAQEAPDEAARAAAHSFMSAPIATAQPAPTPTAPPATLATAPVPTPDNQTVIVVRHGDSASATVTSPDAPAQTLVMTGVPVACGGDQGTPEGSRLLRGALQTLNAFVVGAAVAHGATPKVWGFFGKSPWGYLATYAVEDAIADRLTARSCTSTQNVVNFILAGLAGYNAFLSK